jgi:hypothetical protein
VRKLSLTSAHSGHHRNISTKKIIYCDVDETIPQLNSALFILHAQVQEQIPTGFPDFLPQHHILYKNPYWTYIKFLENKNLILSSKLFQKDFTFTVGNKHPEMRFGLHDTKRKKPNP